MMTCLAMILCAQSAWAAGAAPPPPAGAAVAPTPLSEQEAATYKLGPGDKLNIITFDETQLTGTFAVGANGMVSLPWIGDVPAQGHTEAELRDMITARLKDGYILNPQVSLQVLTFRPFYILGEVNKPGEYPYVSGLTVLSAVATAGGFTYRAAKHKVFIRHSGESQEERIPLASDTEVRAGDTVRIAERYF
jgi:polysaccharide export outer membrane protein